MRLLRFLAGLLSDGPWDKTRWSFWTRLHGGGK